MDLTKFFQVGGDSITRGQSESSTVNPNCGQPVNSKRGGLHRYKSAATVNAAADRRKKRNVEEEKTRKDRRLGVTNKRRGFEPEAEYGHDDSIAQGGNTDPNVETNRKGLNADGPGEPVRRRQRQTAQDRRNKLEEFRLKKRQEKKEARLCKKPPFLVGAVHHTTPHLELAKVSKGRFTWASTSTRTPSRVFVFKGHPKETLSRKKQVLGSGRSGGTAASSASVKKPNVGAYSGRVTRSRTGKPVVSESGSKTRNKGKRQDKPSVTSVRIAADENCINNPNTGECGSNAVVAPLTPARRSIAARIVTPFPTRMEDDDDDDDIDSDEERDVVPEVLMPITPRSIKRSAGRTPKRISEVAKLYDSLRPEVCYERGSYSENRRKNKRKLQQQPNKSQDVIASDEKIESFDEMIGSGGRPGSALLFEESPSSQYMRPGTISFADFPTTPGEEIVAKKKLEFREPVCFNVPEQRTVEEAATSPENDVNGFRALLLEETNKLTEACDEWERIVADVEFADDAVGGRIRAAIGKARILMSQKGRFQQFRGLIDNCEHGRGEQVTTCMDLQGFWDMISVQVDGLKTEFNELKELKENGWKAAAAAPEPKTIIGKPERKAAAAARCKKSKKPTTKPKVDRARVGGIRALMAERRRQLQEGRKAGGVGVASLAVTDAVKVFDGGFFAVHSPSRTPVMVTPKLQDRDDDKHKARSSRLLKSIPRIPRSMSRLSRGRLSNPNSPLAVIRVSATARRSLATEPKGSYDVGLEFSAVASSTYGSFLSTQSPVESGRRKRRVSTKAALDTSDLMLFNTPVPPGSERKVRRSVRLSGRKIPYY